MIEYMSHVKINVLHCSSLDMRSHAYVCQQQALIARNGKPSGASIRFGPEINIPWSNHIVFCKTNHMPIYVDVPKAITCSIYTGKHYSRIIRTTAVYGRLNTAQYRWHPPAGYGASMIKQLPVRWRGPYYGYRTDGLYRLRWTVLHVCHFQSQFLHYKKVIICVRNHCNH